MLTPPPPCSTGGIPAKAWRLNRTQSDSPGQKSLIHFTIKDGIVKMTPQILKDCKENSHQNLPIQTGLSNNDREGALVVVVGSGVHVQMEPVVATADGGDGVAGHRVGGEVGRFTITIVFGSHG